MKENFADMKSVKYTGLSLSLTALLVWTIWTTFAPGFMSNDSVMQYQTALSQHYTDSHPAIMSYVWHVSQSLMEGPQGLLALHILLLVTAIFVWDAELANRRGRVLIPAMFFLPWILNFAGVLWKDVGMAFALLIAAGLMLNRKRSWQLALLGLPFLYYAFAVRHNAILATAPLIFVVSYTYLRKYKIASAFVLTLVVSIALWLITSAISYGVLKAEKRHLETFLMGDDIAMISAKTGTETLPWVKKDDLIECTKPRILYERAICFIGRGYDPSGSLVVGIPHETTHEMWKDAVLAHPLLFAAIRYDAFLYFLRSPQMAPAYVWQPGIMHNSMGISLSNPEHAELLEHYIISSQSGIFAELFKPYTWLTLTLLLLLLSACMAPSPSRTQIVALNLSALGCYASLLAAVPSVDFRYAYWCIIATNLSIIILLASIKRGGFHRWA